MAFTKVSDVVTQARVLLQDESSDRYTDASIIQALNEGLLEARRQRPDLFRDRLDNVPQYVTADATNSTLLVFEQMYMPALVNFVCGRVQLRDDEATTDTRATVFLNTFSAKLTNPVA